MPIQSRSWIALLFAFLTLPLVAQNSGSQSPPQPSGITGLTIHTDKGQQQTIPTAPPPTKSGVVPVLAEANQLFSQRKIPEALTRYQALVKADPKVVPAQVGMLRCLVMLGKLDEAQSAANAAVATLPGSAPVLAMAADVQFRLGRMPESERLYVKAQNLNPGDPEVYIGLARIYKAASLYRRAYDNLKKAHDIAPDNGPVQMLYFHSLPQPDQIPQLESYLAKPNLNPQIARALQGYLAFLKKNASAPVHACKVVSKVQQTDTKLEPVARADTKLGGVGLNVKINKGEVHLALDTGATGILLGRTASEKLGLQRLGYQPIVGVGDSGTQGGFTALADRIRIGDLEFQDCVVKVTDAATPVTGQDGLIGADVFSSFLIDIDIPGAKLRLSPLPKRPDETGQAASLQTMSSDQGEDGANETPETPRTSTGLTDLPKDAYVAPTMKDWTKVYRFRSLLMVPTLVNQTGPLLFLIDTGSFTNILSPKTAQQVTQLSSDPSMRISGMSGKVGQVYRAQNASLQFGRYVQENEDVVTFDISSISRQTGVEVGGILGFKMLCILQVKIDYRDGLVDFVFDPHRLPKQIRIGH